MDLPQIKNKIKNRMIEDPMYQYIRCPIGLPIIGNMDAHCMDMPFTDMIFQPIRGGQDRFLHSLHVCLSSDAKILERGKEYRGG